MGLALLAGCGDDGNTSTPDAPAAPDAAIDAPPIDGADECPPDSILRTGAAYSYGNANGRLGGVTVCVVSTDRCTVSDAQGNFSLCVPADADYALSATKANYDKQIGLFDGALPEAASFEIGDVPVVTALWEPGDLTYPPTTDGLLYVDVRRPDATVAITPAAGTVYYSGPDTVIDPALTMTGTSAGVYIGDVPAGEYTISVSVGGTQYRCSNLHGVRNDVIGVGGWEGTTAGTVRAPVVAGWTTAVYLQCNAPP